MLVNRAKNVKRHLLASQHMWRWIYVRTHENMGFFQYWLSVDYWNTSSCKDPCRLHDQWHVCWCPGDGRSQTISLHCIKKFSQNIQDGVSNHRRLCCLFKRLFRCKPKKTSKSFVSLALVRVIHRWPVKSPPKGAVTRKCFHLMTSSWPPEQSCDFPIADKATLKVIGK